MANYIALCTFTDQGIRAIKNSAERADAVKELAAKFGATMTQLYWTMGQYDLIATIDAPDDESATAFSLATASGGNVRVQTLRAFSRTELAGITRRLD
jgi:uncharacterized protein with GYD domain